eukprot:TRINITY_DN27121_c0_g1_i2.p1 TRINITY_DN27121_c0_g1~~TRINITY_DN27121_c0_g1_i2.p1  ORF type:complete len:259 (+),score=93.03 TRINITY_DN27121_c0_g1_i2:79-777(+)
MAADAGAASTAAEPAAAGCPEARPEPAAEPPAPSCVTCSKDGAKYRTPCCRKHYCCVKCYKAHFDLLQCDGVRKETEEELQAREERKRARELREAELIDDDTITSRQLQAITVDPRVRRELRDPNLQALIANIDRHEDRLNALEAAQAVTPEFRSFCDHLALVILRSAQPATASAVRPKRRRVGGAPAADAAAAEGAAPEAPAPDGSADSIAADAVARQEQARLQQAEELAL